MNVFEQLDSKNLNDILFQQIKVLSLMAIKLIPNINV